MMYIRNKISVAILSLIMLCTCTLKPITGREKLDWLIGTWVNKTSKGKIYETWRKENTNELSGKNYILKEKDTIVFETIRLVKEQEGWFYIPSVKNQNDGLPVRFAAATISKTQLMFKNLEHDFPQTIAYTKITGDSLVAEISGIKNGQERKQSFPMKRLK